MRALALLVAVSLVAALGLGAAATAGESAKRPSVAVKPKRVAAGERIKVRGKGFKPRSKVQLLIGPPRSEASPVGKARTDRRGRFRKRLRVGTPGRWVLLACRRDCAVKAQDSFRVVPG